VIIQISKFKKGNKKQAKYGQNLITVLKIKQKHGLIQKTKANTKTTKAKIKT
jgi:hypothetical protein